MNIYLDPRLVHDGSERDKLVEAILCCQAQATDLEGRVLGGGEPVDIQILRARKIVELLPMYGYQITKVEREA